MSFSSPRLSNVRVWGTMEAARCSGRSVHRSLEERLVDPVTDLGIVVPQCDTDLPSSMRLGEVHVSCEGWSRPGDTFVVKGKLGPRRDNTWWLSLIPNICSHFAHSGSCGLDYNLIQIDRRLDEGGLYDFSRGHNKLDWRESPRVWCKESWLVLLLTLSRSKPRYSSRSPSLGWPLVSYTLSYGHVWHDTLLDTLPGRSPTSGPEAVVVVVALEDRAVVDLGSTVELLHHLHTRKIPKPTQHRRPISRPRLRRRQTSSPEPH